MRGLKDNKLSEKLWRLNNRRKLLATLISGICISRKEKKFKVKDL